MPFHGDMTSAKWFKLSTILLVQRGKLSDETYFLSGKPIVSVPSPEGALHDDVSYSPIMMRLDCREDD